MICEYSGPCIYGIQNQETGMLYIGSTVNAAKRSSDHIYALRRGDHPNSRLQRSYNNHGEGKFQFFVIERLERDMDIKLIRKIEIEWMEIFDWDRLYNQHKSPHGAAGLSGKDHPMWGKRGKDNPNYGRKHTEQTKRRVGRASKGRPGVKGGDHHNARGVKLVDDNSGNIIKRWDALSEAAKDTQVSSQKIWSECNNKHRPIYDGMRFRYEDDHSPVPEYVHPNSKKTAKICPESGRTLQIYNSATEAGLAMGLTGAFISSVCIGTCKTAGGFRWEYV
jgi:hypothetical protein